MIDSAGGRCSGGESRTIPPTSRFPIQTDPTPKVNQKIPASSTQPIELESSYPPSSSSSFPLLRREADNRRDGWGGENAEKVSPRFSLSFYRTPRISLGSLRHDILSYLSTHVETLFSCQAQGVWRRTGQASITQANAWMT